MTEPDGDSLFSSAVRWARRLTSSLRSASAISCSKSRSPADLVSSLAAFVCSFSSTVTSVVRVSTRVMRALFRSVNRWARLARYARPRRW